MTQEKDKGILESVSNALKVLKSFSQETPVKRVGEIAEELNISKSTASRLIKTLQAEGFLIHDEHSPGYRLGKEILSLGGIFTSSYEFYSDIGPYLNELVSITKENAHLAIISGDEVIYLIKYMGPYYSNTKIEVGNVNPPHATSSGKILLAYADNSVVDYVLQQGLTAFTENTITNPIKLRKEFEKIRRQKYVVSIGEYDIDNLSIAAPVFDIDGKVVSAIGVAGPLSRINSEEKIQNIKREVIKTAKYASEILGWEGD
ncbi:IclR family transcriptional regulator [Aerococcaceae bacterium DSM 111020]|nr:IclR family transcriptional regulator [Aerococcaceae bacterium DSM 111020]